MRRAASYCEQIGIRVRHAACGVRLCMWGAVAGRREDRMTCCPGCACQKRAGPDRSRMWRSPCDIPRCPFSVELFSAAFAFSALTKPYICISFEESGE